MSKLLVLHGPNLNMLGMREPEHYGNDTLTIINNRLESTAQKNGHKIVCLQSNAEHELINEIHNANDIDFMLFNPAGLTHTSISLRDAIIATKIPFIEIHISNIFSRENFRHQSFFSDIAVGVICGLGTQGYDLALIAAIEYLEISFSK